jgi:hypothetical protein
VGNFSAIYEAEDILLEDRPLKTSRRKTMMPTPSNPKQLLIMTEFKDYDFTRSVNEAERKEQLQRLLENSKQLEESRSKMNIEEIKEVKEDDDEENENNGDDFIDRQ